MPDFITPDERAQIDRFLGDRGATVVPTGVSGAEYETPVWRRLSASDRRRIEARRANIRDAAETMTVAQIAGRFQCSREMIYRTLREAEIMAVGMADRR